MDPLSLASSEVATMGSVPQKVLNWLYHVLRHEYQDINRTYTDVSHTISQYPNFSIKTEVYTYENGQSSLLVNIAGTLPGNFRGITYMFPISIWVPHGYPRAVPMVYVAPTRDMAIRPGQHVSGEGRIYHPYLAAWREDRSNMVEFLSILQDVFAREPPVIARADPPPIQQMPQSGPPPVMGRDPPPIPPLPPELRPVSSQMGRSLATSASGAKPPQLPPKPFPPDGQNIRFSSARLPPVPPQPREREERYIPPPNGYQQPYTTRIPQRPQNPSETPGRVQAQFLRTPPNHPVTPIQNPQLRRDSYSPVSPLSPDRHHTEPPLGSMQGSQSSHFGQIQPPRQALFENPPQISESHPRRPPQFSQHQNQLPSSQPYPDPQYQHPNTYPAPQPKSNPPKDLLTSPFETPAPGPSPNIAPPPIPPNPQKDALLSALSHALTQKIQSSHAANMAAISPLRAQQSALHTTLTAMNREISQLNDLQSLLNSNELILHQAMRDADQVMEDAKHRKVPSVDDVLVAPTMVARQLYELVADETSLEECRGVVGRALDRGRIGSDVWAKQTRSLAREEFLRKALIRKIAQGMGLVRDERWE